MSAFADLYSLFAGGTLPGLKFFEPKPKFMDWLKATYGEKKIYDVGAGVGHVAKAVSDAGMNVFALDLHHRDNAEFEVHIANALSHRFEPGSVVMLCRPCHGTFVEGTIRRALERNVAAIIYISKAKNVASDLYGFRKRFRCVLRGAGAENESVYVLETA